MERAIQGDEDAYAGLDSGAPCAFRGAGIAIPSAGGVIYITSPGSAELRKYTLP